MLEAVEYSLEKFLLIMLDLPLGPSMLMSSNTLLVSLRLDIVEELKGYLFTISLLGPTIQDSGIEERSRYLILFVYVQNLKK